MHPASPSVPRSVRVAGVMVLVQGVAGLVFAGVALFLGLRASGEPALVRIAAATGVMLALFGAIVVTDGVFLALGRRGARTPAIVTQLLLLGVCWYAAGPSSQLAYGVLAAAYCVAVLVLLFCPPAQRWITDIPRGRAEAGDGLS